MDKSIKPSRIQYPKKNICQWKKVLFDYFNNNDDKLTVPEFCKKHNVGEYFFYKWRHKLYPKSFKRAATKATGKSKLNKRHKSSAKYQDNKSNQAKFIAVKTVDDYVKSITESKSGKLIKTEPGLNSPDISSPLKISLANLNLEFNKGCHLSELSKLISLLNVAEAQ